MPKIFGIGETILDIIFKNDQPTAAVPGGSSFNAIISLGRAGVDTTFISETGDDRVGQRILNFMKENGVSPDYMTIRPGSKSPLALAFLNEQSDAEYLFYKDHPNDNPEFDYPEVNSDDMVLFGSFYAINPVIREKVGGFLRYAKARGAILYYDVNFRASHLHELEEVMPNILENFALSTIVRGSEEDFYYMFGSHDTAQIYRNQIAPYCSHFICTKGSKPIEVFTPQLQAKFPVAPVATLSTIGAGDNFNAGFLYGLLQQQIGGDALESLDQVGWAQLVASGQRFSANVCQSVDNYIDVALGKQLQMSSYA